MKRLKVILISLVLIVLNVPLSFAKEVVVFEDDFNNGVDNWQSMGYAFPSIELRCANENNNMVGELHATKISSEGARIHSPFSGKLDAADYQYSGRMKIGGSNEYVYILFRVQDENDFYGLYYNNYYSQISVVKNGYLNVIKGTTINSASCGIKVGAWFNYKVVTVGNHFEIFINNMEKPVISYTDTDNPVLSGGVGVGMYTGQPNEKSVFFDDIKVTYDDGKKESYLGGAVASNDTVGGDYEKEAFLLKNLGIMGEYAEGVFSAEAYVTRGEMADIGLKMINKSDIENVTSSPASDVPKNHTYAKQIGTMIDLGYMSTTDSFRPDEPITYEEAVTVCVRLLGYQPIVNISGGYFEGYLEVANKYKLLEGVNVAKGYVMTRGNIAKLVFNTLDAPIMKLSSVGDTVTYEEYADDNILSEYFNIYHSTGVISATENAALKGGDTAFLDCVVINNVQYLIGVSKAEKYFGYNVEYYYYSDSDLSYIAAVIPKRNKELTVAADDIEDFSANTYKYYLNNKTKTLRISALDTDVIYNGKSIVGTKYVPDNGYVTFIDNDNDGDYEVVDIHDYRNVIVDSVNTTDAIIKDKLNSKNNIVLKNNNIDAKYSIKNTAGKQLTLSKITPNSVVSAAISEDGTVADIIACTDKLIGSVTAINTYENKLKIDSAEYDIAVGYDDYTNVKVGKQMQCFLTYEGKIAYMVETSDGAAINYSYVIRVSNDTDNDNKLNIKCFSGAVNSIVMLTAADNVVIDGKRISGNELLKTAIKKGLCIIKKNGKGEISEIDYPYTTEPQSSEVEDSIRLISGGSNSEIRFKGWNQFYNNFTISNSTVYMTVPKDDANEELFSVGSVIGRFENDETYSVAGYSTIADGFNADLVVRYISTSAQDSHPLLFKDKCETINDDDEVTTKITVLNTAGKEVSYNVSTRYLTEEQSEKLKKLDFGDVVVFKMSKDNEITGVSSVIYDCSEKIATNLGFETDLNYKWRTCMGNVYTTQGNTLVINRDFPTEGKPENLDVSVSKGAIYMVDLKNKEINEATLGEFDSFKLYRLNATPVILIQYYLENRMLIGYRY